MDAMSVSTDRQRNMWDMARSKSGRFVIVMLMTASFCVVELVVGNMTSSLALVADAFHMLSDLLAQFIGLMAIRLAKRAASNQFTFGWARAETLGALINAVFLIALCLSIFIEAINRFFKVEELSDTSLLIWVGIGGLCINIVGLFLFSGHGHSHSHGHGHDQADNNQQIDEQAHGHSHGHDAEVEQTNAASHDEVNDVPRRLDSRPASSGNMNMRGVFLHLLGDALGSVIVIIGAVVVKYTDFAGRFYIDPVLSIILVIILMSTTIPLFKESAMILLQTVPRHIDMSLLKQAISEIPGIRGVHELHIWSLANERLVGSVHVTCLNQAEYMNAARELKEFFHQRGVHSLTVQPELIVGDNSDDFNDRSCLLACQDDDCQPNMCCVNPNPNPNPNPSDNVRVTRRTRSSRTDEV